MTASTQSRVLLENVQVKQSGTYLCEVTVTPGYYALMQFANMTVVGKSCLKRPVFMVGLVYNVFEIVVKQSKKKLRLTFSFSNTKSLA